MKTDDFLKCIANKNRRKILTFIGNNEKCVCEFEKEFGLEQSLVSHHLQLLKNCGLVTSYHKGKNIYYKLTDKEVSSLLKKIETLSEKLASSEECVKK